MEFIPAVVNRHLDCIYFTEDGGLLLAASSLTNRYWTGSLWHFDSPDTAPDIERCAAGVELNCGISDAKWVKGSSNVIAACDSGNLALYELIDKGHTFKHLSQAMAHDDLVTCVSVNADQTKATSASQDTRIKLWDMEEFTCTTTYQAHSDTVGSTAWHPSESSIFLSSSQDGRLILWDTRNSKPAVVLRNTSLPALPTCVAWQPSSKLTVAVGTETGHLLLLDIRNVSAPSSSSIKCHDRGIHRIVFAPESSDLLASVSDDCTVAVTDFTHSSPKLLYKDKTSHSDFVRGVDWNPVDGRLFSCGWDFKVVGRTVPLLDGAAGDGTTVETNGIVPETMDTSSQNHISCDESKDRTLTELSDQEVKLMCEGK